MTYEEAKKHKEYLTTVNSYHSKQLQAYPKNELGLVPDDIRESLEYKNAKQEYVQSFRKLQNFNSYFMKNFKKEYLKERRDKCDKK